ncbi:putative transcriptional regulator [Phyllobacterium ifriqiyense]|uniref:UPF0301 protein QFZ34_003600 n=2 Tax=Phyllobacteriaceae TaxID=69277 RepID=A0ABU0SCD0_9HYPH|nr:putative transcriptional regulator [Phyllobacterium ifriqiyense]
MPVVICKFLDTFTAMEIFRDASKNTGFLNGQFLLAMPGMDDSRFARSVIYVCAHSEKGAMGLIINRAQEMEFADILVQLGVLDEEQAIVMPERTRDFLVRSGGPVEMRRGFVLHSDDYLTDSTMPVAEEICLTGTIDILRAISGGRGPRKALMTLGYSGWASGQLETEIANNGWLTCQAPQELLFDTDMDRKYDRILSHMGVDPSRLATVAGHA